MPPLFVCEGGGGELRYGSTSQARRCQLYRKG